MRDVEHPKRSRPVGATNPMSTVRRALPGARQKDQLRKGGFVVLADSSINRPCWTDYQLIPKIFITTEIIIGFSSGFDSAMRSVIATRVPLLIAGLPSALFRAPFF